MPFTEFWEWLQGLPLSQYVGFTWWLVVYVKLCKRGFMAEADAVIRRRSG